MATITDEPPSLVEIIRRVPLFEGLSETQMMELGAASRRISAAPGELVIRQGDEGNALLVILSGELEITRQEGGQEITLATRRMGEILGEMSLLEQWPRTASARAIAASDLLEVDAAAFRKVLEVDPRIATTILRTMAGRLRSTEASLMQREKLASLGTLAAGLAHELNNPAAAIQRSASYLRTLLEATTRANAELRELPLAESERQRIEHLRHRLEGGKNQSLDSGGEDRIISRLAAVGVSDAWEVGAPLASAGWSADDIDGLCRSLAPVHQSAVFRWLGSELGARQLLDEIQRSGRAISDIVRAVKSYAYLDQAAIQDVDVPTTLNDTLMILKHKLRDVEIVRDYEPDLPRIEVHAGELNQVWTNLIDNAVDAMAGRGTVTIRAHRSADGIEVAIADTGPGIPASIAARIFDPFFTTKPQGVGTGLGLHIAHNIIVNRHHGRIDVDSRPGRTEFRVFVPQRLPRASGGPNPAAPPEAHG